MFKAYADFWKGYVDFSGRSSRSQFWYAFLCNMLVSWIIGLIGGIVGAASQGAALLFLAISWIYSMAVLLPSLAIQVRRLRDAGYHWAFIFFHLLPIIGQIVLLVFYCMPSKPAVTNMNNPYQG